MSWTLSNGVWTKSGTTREVVMSSTPLSPSEQVRIHLATPADAVRVLVNATRDGRTGYEVGVLGANFVVRRVVFGVPGATLLSVPHEQVDGVPFFFEVRPVGRVITIYLNGSSTPSLTYTTNGEYDAFTHWGFVSVVNGARVMQALRCALVPVIVTRERMLVCVAGGRLYTSVDGQTFTEIARNVTKSEGYVSLAELRGKVYIVDGQRGRVFDPIGLAVGLWEPSSGSLPGFTDAGTTTLWLLKSHGGRLWGVSLNDTQNLYTCALNNANDWDTSSETSGRAFTLPLARTGLSGQAIRALQIHGSEDLIVAGATTIYKFSGDPARGQVLFKPISTSIGVSGPDAITLADEGRILFHSPEGGLYMLPLGGEPVPLSGDWLTEGIQFPIQDRDNYRVQLHWHVRGKGVYLFQTANASVDSLHFFFDERASRKGLGGFFPESYPIRVGPTASIVYDSRVLMGGRDGYIYTFEDPAIDTITDTDDGDAITSHCYLTPVHDEPIMHDSILQFLRIQLGAESGDVKVRVYKGQTPEAGYDGDLRVLAYERTASYGCAQFTNPVRAPALFVQMYNNTSGASWWLEAAACGRDEAMLSTRHAWRAAAAAPPPCAFPTGGSAGGSSAGSGSPPSSGPGAGGSVLPSGSPPAGSPPASGGSPTSGIEGPIGSVVIGKFSGGFSVE